MLAVDPPDHTRYRKLVTRAFSATRDRGAARAGRRIADDLLDAMAAKAAADGTVDLVADYASLLPATVIAEMLGAPVEMRRQFLQRGRRRRAVARPGPDLPRLPPGRAGPARRCSAGWSATWSGLAAPPPTTSSPPSSRCTTMGARAG